MRLTSALTAGFDKRQLQIFTYETGFKQSIYSVSNSKVNINKISGDDIK